tara:strand:+ start:888 stop:2318 length:1431 start_codon:yes stop_codon:yes gene_type:complete
MDILRIFEALKIFTKDEKDTVVGLVFFSLLGLGAIRYILIPVFPTLDGYVFYMAIPVVLVVFVVWIYNRHIQINVDEFSIGVAPFQVHLLDAKAQLSWEAKRDLKNQLVDYVHSALYFNRENLALDKYLQVIRLPNRIKVLPKNAQKWVESTKVDLMIWGDAYYDNDFLHFRPRFNFLKEPKNIFYKKFKKSLNELESFKIELSKSLEDKKTDLNQLMHYISYLGLMFHGIELSNKRKYEEANELFEYALKMMKKNAFTNKSLSDIYLATRFFYAQNFHSWGNAVVTQNKAEGLRLYQNGADSFFKRVADMDKLKIKDNEARLENTFIYGIYLLIKQGKLAEAGKKLDNARGDFDKNTRFLFYLYKGLVQKDAKKAEGFFDKALLYSKDDSLCFEKIADYYFSRGMTKKSIAFFNKRLKVSGKQVYNPSLLEESVHGKLSDAYAKELNLIASVREKAIALFNEQKNVDREKKLLVE